MRFLLLIFISSISTYTFANTNDTDPKLCADMTDRQLRLRCFDNWYETQGATTQVKRQRLSNETLWIRAQREEFETSMEDNRFVLLPYKTNYFLAATYNDNVSNQDSESSQLNSSNGLKSLDKTESKLQFSLKTRIIDDPFGSNSSVWVGYTQLSLWQLYKESSPFREINYEPEIYFQFVNPLGLNVVKNTIATIGFNHQSNGRSTSISRSWNRILGSIYWGNEDYIAGMKAWWRIPEHRIDDDNPDISKFFGSGEIFLSRKYYSNTWAITLRNNLRSGENRGSLQLDWSFPLGFTPRLKGYIQYYNGYGESLIDYNDSVHRIGIGVMLSDWL